MSPIFSSRESYCYDDPSFIENLLKSPNVEETLAGTRFNGCPALSDNSKGRLARTSCIISESFMY